jgi:hypothetical protein
MDRNSDIVDFYRNKKIMVTGATGFLGNFKIKKPYNTCLEGDTLCSPKNTVFPLFTRTVRKI